MARLRTLDDYRGLSAQTGGTVSGEAHLRQSIRDILTTPIGSRVMRRNYGSRIPELMDAPMNASIVADLVATTAQALRAFEPRITLKRVLVRAVSAGAVTLDLIVAVNGRELRLDGVV
ncbi:MAG: phage baseplate protein [Alphaproteobacteria bacterium]|nr:MAG: phage baseplate protein [Alphaproteobacteria bacterium]